MPSAGTGISPASQPMALGGFSTGIKGGWGDGSTGFGPYPLDGSNAGPPDAPTTTTAITSSATTPASMIMIDFFFMSPPWKNEIESTAERNTPPRKYLTTLIASCAQMECRHAKRDDLITGLFQLTVLNAICYLAPFGLAPSQNIDNKILMVIQNLDVVFGGSWVGAYIFNCTLYKFAYVPSRAISSSCVPCSSIPSSVNTTILCAFLTVDRRCAMTMVVRLSASF